MRDALNGNGSVWPVVLERFVPVMAALGNRTSLPDWRVRALDGNHLPASEKRLAPLRGFRSAALPGQSLVAYDPDSALMSDLLACCEDAHTSERSPRLTAAGQHPARGTVDHRTACLHPHRAAAKAEKRRGRRPTLPPCLRPSPCRQVDFPPPYS